MSEHADPPEAPFGELEALARPAGPTDAYRGPWGARLVERTLGALPVLGMALLAAFTWWLVKNSPTQDAAAAAAAPSRDPDYVMQGFVLRHYGGDGALRSELEGDQLRHYPVSDTVEVEGVRLSAIDAQGRRLRGRADRARSNGDASEVTLIGDARVVREPAPGEGEGARIEIRGELLEVLAEAERVRSDRPVTLLTGRGELRAGSLDYSRSERVARLGGRVTGQLRPGVGPQ